MIDDSEVTAPASEAAPDSDDGTPNSGDVSDSDDAGHESGDGGPGSDDATSAAPEPGIPGRIWRRLVAAGNWFADTFRGHSGANQFQKREK